MILEDSGRFLARIPRGLGIWMILEDSGRFPSQNYLGGLGIWMILEDSGRFLARIPRGLVSSS